MKYEEYFVRREAEAAAKAGFQPGPSPDQEAVYLDKVEEIRTPSTHMTGSDKFSSRPRIGSWRQIWRRFRQQLDSGSWQIYIA